MNLTYLRHVDWWSRVAVGQPDECWPWRQSSGSHGYGQTWDGQTVLLAHRVAWALTNGPIPDDLTIDHLCRSRRCCNPAHLRLLPNVENARMNGNWAKTHCKRGHEFSPENTRTDGDGARHCIACQDESKARRAIARGAPYPPPTSCLCRQCGREFQRKSMMGKIPGFCSASCRARYHA